jgi:Na+-translocating ferredoxin:NAD+ oxidoreductase subunit B
VSENTFERLAVRLNELPNGFPPTEDGSELRLLEKIFTPEEAELAAQLRLTLETPKQLAARIGGDPKELKAQLKTMLRKGLITAGKAEGGLGYGLLPFVVGIYEMQMAVLDEEMSRLFEAYYHQAFGHMLNLEPAFHRVVPVNETVQTGMEIHPYESVTDIINNANAWGVQDCICRKQKALIGDACDHPIENCMVFSSRSGNFDGHPTVRALTHEEALQTIKDVADAGLVHSVSNTQDGLHYVCNCCTCSCGILRGMSEMGIANVVARSAFVNTVDDDLCQGCETCIDYCQFDALALATDALLIKINTTRCVGCGVCVPACPDEALVLVRRPEDEVMSIPSTEHDWLNERAEARGLDIKGVL